MQSIADRYTKQAITFEPGNRLHRLAAILCDTWYDDLTDQRIAELEEHAMSWRWMSADGDRVDGNQLPADKLDSRR